MGELQQQHAARSEKYPRPLVDAPHHRARAEYARAILRCGRSDDRELALEISLAQDPGCAESRVDHLSGYFQLMRCHASANVSWPRPSARLVSLAADRH